MADKKKHELYEKASKVTDMQSVRRVLMDVAVAIEGEPPSPEGEAPKPKEKGK